MWSSLFPVVPKYFICAMIIAPACLAPCRAVVFFSLTLSSDTGATSSFAEPVTTQTLYLANNDEKSASFFFLLFLKNYSGKVFFAFFSYWNSPCLSKSSSQMSFSAQPPLTSSSFFSNSRSLFDSRNKVFVPPVSSCLPRGLFARTCVL